MANQLSSIPVAARRRMAAALGGFAVLFAVIGAVSVTADSGLLTVVAIVTFVVAALLALMAWGTLNSIRMDAAEAELYAELEQAIREHDLTCNCGGGHAPSEHAAHAGQVAHDDGSCAQDGACGHDCATCTLAALRTGDTRNA